jgi:hypothetical protein
MKKYLVLSALFSMLCVMNIVSMEPQETPDSLSHATNEFGGPLTPAECASLPPLTQQRLQQLELEYEEQQRQKEQLKQQEVESLILKIKQEEQRLKANGELEKVHQQLQFMVENPQITQQILESRRQELERACQAVRNMQANPEAYRQLIEQAHQAFEQGHKPVVINLVDEFCDENFLNR